MHVARANPVVLALAVLPPAAAGAATVKIDTVACLGQPNCQRLSNGTVEVVVTTDVGPRVARYAFVGGENMLGETPGPGDQTELGVWKPYGGHRLWHAPEAKPRSYSPDNAPVPFEVVEGNAIRLRQPVEPGTGIEKEMTVTLDPDGTRVTIHHRLTNRGLWAAELAAWALTIMRGGGTAVVPQEPYGPHPQNLLPVRPIALWAYTDLSDPRFALGPRFLRVRSMEERRAPQKIGVGNKRGWAAYHQGRTLFVKRFGHRAGASYPDFGSNCEIYTAGSFIELESLGPLVRLAPGESTEHVEHWYLFGDVDLPADDEAAEAALAPLIARTSGP